MYSLKKIIRRSLKWIYGIPARLIFQSFGSGSIVYWPGEVQNGKYMVIENDCYIKSNFWLQALNLGTPPKFIMGEFSYINRFCQIVICNKVVIGKRVTIGDNVYIADTTHGYKDVSKPVSSQDLEIVGEVSIGDGSWIGRNASIMGCKIGKNCVVGTGSFVKRDIPDYCVVVGNPCRIVKRYNFETCQWEKTDKDGNFLKEN